MILNESKLRHLSFFEALGRDVPNSPEWRDASAGLVVLRLFDQWVESDYTLSPTDLWGWTAVRDAVYQMGATSPARTILEGIVAEIRIGGRDGGYAAGVVSRLVAYGRVLSFEGRFDLAADVFQTIADHAERSQPDITIDASMQLGYCLRVLGHFDRAADAYSKAGALATVHGDRPKQLRARIADAKIAIDVGNLPTAEAILDDVILSAGDHELSEVRGIALHDRAGVAFRRKDYPLAVQFVHTALASLKNPAARDNALSDLGAYFATLGMLDAARDTHLILSHTASEQYTRWVATINLLEIAAIDRCEPVFEQYRRELADVSLPPALRVSYLLYVGRGCIEFDRSDAAGPLLSEALELASRFRLNQLAYEAEEAIAALAAGMRVAAKATAYVETPNSQVLQIAQEMAQLRHSAVAAT